MRLIVNGVERTVHAPPMTALGAVLRDELALTGTKLVCGEGFCGACLVEVDDAAVPSCQVPIGLLDGRQVRTIEGYVPLSPVQQAFKDNDAVQCGMCFPGMAISLTALLRENPQPSEEDVRAHLSGNICRCTGYQRIVEAVAR
ncbi:(2Fe-2S)-binding protein [Amycolatopsis jejuensis]|uniref:(2Fe-2S)-binding protein n=1 Tax=Amycolatopsis jejuensis TaxID=330084 RepID=UPI00052613E3|nr:(2Fe-2S)-binding protein [Amycolatopsis jejuensis]